MPDGTPLLSTLWLPPAHTNLIVSPTLAASLKFFLPPKVMPLSLTVVVFAAGAPEAPAASVPPATAQARPAATSAWIFMLYLPVGAARPLRAVGVSVRRRPARGLALA